MGFCSNEELIQETISSHGDCKKTHPKYTQTHASVHAHIYSLLKCAVLILRLSVVVCWYSHYHFYMPLCISALKHYSPLPKLLQSEGNKTKK